MRRVATGLLVLMALAFLILRQLDNGHAAWGYAIAFTEAAMVGGLADWFAVTALFRHPLGIPIPHTAIIPVNKDRIAETMAQFLRENFLTPQVVARRVGAFNFAASLGDFLSAPRERGGARLREGAADLVADLLRALDPERLGGQVRAGLAAQLERLEVSPLLGKMLEAVIADRRHWPLIEDMIAWVGEMLAANEDIARALIKERSNGILRWTGLDEKVANSILDGTYKLLAEILVIEDHPVRIRMSEGLEKLARNLQHDPDLRARVEQAKREILANEALGDWWMGIWERLRHGMIAAMRDPDAALAGQLGTALAELGAALRGDPALQMQVNRFARRTIVGIVARYGGEIVRLVSETVKRWDAQTVTGRIEGAVGRDLQFIRINGTLVGGCVGLVIHAVDHLL
jgi:uncharacterized membrane-anchored protein YjiN (DUF445 family)